MKKLLAILFAALLACALALPAMAVEANENIVAISEEAVTISAPIADEVKDLTPSEALKVICEGYRAGKFTLCDILRAPFDILF